MKIFPIGTSRLHEPLSLLNQEEVVFPGVGYFHTTSQVVDWIKILRGEKELNSHDAKFFFRKDQTLPNPFDLNLWKSENFKNTLKEKQILFEKADVFIIEISTTKTHVFKDIHVNGNPNFSHNLSYAEAWGEYGYYEKMHPDMLVQRLSDEDNIYENLKYINDYLLESGKISILLGHLVDPDNPNQARVKHNRILKEAIQKLEDTQVFFYDTEHLVSEFGFRILDDKTIDIHHLPWEGLKKQSKEMYELLSTKLNSKSKELYLSLGENSLTDNILDRHNLKSFSTPYSNGRTNLDYAIFCEKTNYDTLIDKDLLICDKTIVYNRNIPITDSIFDLQHIRGFEFTHSDVLNNKTHRASMQRKIDRLVNIKGQEDITFFYHYRVNKNLNYSKIFEKASEFISFYKPKETNSKIILFSQKIVTDKKDRKIMHEQVKDNVHHFVFYTEYVWGGKNEDIFWARNDDDLIQIMIDKVKDIKR
ncbi:MAG: hypothetical protein U9N33_07775 [Campylobacterota bacterium]|nr:hypothetical protein [Campylobacterota bacterium]